jgi:hypothetical protein
MWIFFFFLGGGGDTGEWWKNLSMLKMSALCFSVWYTCICITYKWCIEGTIFLRNNENFFFFFFWKVDICVWVKYVAYKVVFYIPFTGNIHVQYCNIWLLYVVSSFCVKIYQQTCSQDKLVLMTFSVCNQWTSLYLYLLWWCIFCCMWRKNEVVFR